MTRITHRDRWLHYEDGSHLSTSPSTAGRMLDKFERAIRKHLDRHAEQPTATVPRLNQGRDK